MQKFFKKGDDHLKMARHQKWGSPTVFKLQTPNLHQMNLLTHEKSQWVNFQVFASKGDFSPFLVFSWRLLLASLNRASFMARSTFIWTQKNIFDKISYN